MIVCYGRYPDPENGNRRVDCQVKGTQDCPLKEPISRKSVDLYKKEPCCLAIFIPARFITEAKGDKKKAASLYVERLKEELCSS